MSRPTRAALAVVVVAMLVLALGACGGGTAESDLANAKTTPTSGVVGVGDADAGSSSSLAATNGTAAHSNRAAATAKAGAAAGGSADPSTFDPSKHPMAPSTSTPLRYGTAQHPQKDTVPVPLTVQSASCVRLGTTLKVTVISEPDVDVAMIIGYSDNKAHESQALGTTGPDGRLVLDLPIKSDAPTGNADLLVAAGAPDGRRNTDSSRLRVVSEKSSCS